jgi:hypothetical protein
MAKTDSFAVSVLKFLFWVLFIGLCIKAGTLITTASISLFINPEASADLYRGLNLSALYYFDKIQYIMVLMLLVGHTVIKAYITFLVERIFKGFDLSRPFNDYAATLITQIRNLSLATGVTALLGERYCKSLTGKGISVSLDWSGAETLFFAVLIYVIVLVFRKGVELQKENELTI